MLDNVTIDQEIARANAIIAIMSFDTLAVRVRVSLDFCATSSQRIAAN